MVTSKFIRCLFIGTGLLTATSTPCVLGQALSPNSLGPRRAAITSQSTTQPPSAATSSTRAGTTFNSGNSATSSTSANNASSMSQPALPRLTNASNTGGRTGTPSLFGTPGSRAGSPLPAYTADARSGSRTSPLAGTMRVTKGSGLLPNDGGQVWREYDIAPYTSRIRNQTKPEQAVIDWILRETGTEVWFAEPLGILNANSQTLRVYHTPEMQQLVQEVVRRFVESDNEPHVLSVRLMTINSPSWRIRALPLLKSIDIQSPGVEAWLLSRENAAVLVGELQRRGDYRENYTPNLQIQSGQTETIARTRPRVYARSVRMTNYFPGYETVPGQLEEGFALQLSPLMSLDGRTCDAAVKCNIDQIERLVPLTLDVPVGGQVQKVQIQVPQLVSWRFHERFRWPSDQVLLLSCGVIASPTGQPASGNPLAMLNVFDAPGSRSDALLMIECRGKSSEAALSFGLPPGAEAAARTATTAGPSIAIPSSPYSRGRY